MEDDFMENKFLREINAMPVFHQVLDIQFDHWIIWEFPIL